MPLPTWLRKREIPIARRKHLLAHDIAADAGVADAAVVLLPLLAAARDRRMILLLGRIRHHSPPPAWP
jgi:hypothetical protein